MTQLLLPLPLPELCGHRYARLTCCLPAEHTGVHWNGATHWTVGARWAARWGKTSSGRDLASRATSYAGRNQQPLAGGGLEEPALLRGRA